MWLLGLTCISLYIRIIYVPYENWPRSSWAIGIAGLCCLLVGTLAWFSARKKDKS
jgi:LPXTG-motif cell wall-anchored protein